MTSPTSAERSPEPDLDRLHNDLQAEHAKLADRPSAPVGPAVHQPESISARTLGRWAFTGCYPRDLFDFVLGVGRWGVHVTAYVFLLVADRYPPFSLRP